MRKCLELSKLSKARSVKSINVGTFYQLVYTFRSTQFFLQFRRTTPGSRNALLGWAPTNKRKAATPVDATHPAAGLPRRAYQSVFPHFANSHITVRVFPKALLTEPDTQWPDPPYHYAANVKWSEQLERLKVKKVRDINAEQMKSNSVDMSMACVVGKKSTHKSAVIRRHIVRKLKTAVSLIVCRGAYVRQDDKQEDPPLFFAEETSVGPHEWISPGALLHHSHCLLRSIDSSFCYETGHMYSCHRFRSTACHTPS
jgi:hypothetical protein